MLKLLAPYLGSFSGTVLRDFVRSPRIDPVSMGCFVLCLGSLIYVCRNQRRRGGFGWLANLLTAPMFPVAFFGTPCAG